LRSSSKQLYDRLIAHVVAYRVQRGIIVDEAGTRLDELSHFFIG
jgi:hypothetical protein